jgi:hypothetical protein
MKELISTMFVINMSLQSFSQGVLAIPGQTAMIANQAIQIGQQATAIAKAVEILKTAESTYQTVKQENQQLVYIKNYMQEAAENLKHLDNIRYLKLNQIETFLNQVLCLKGENRYYRQNFVNIVNLITGAYNKCNDTGVFKMSWGGIVKNFNEQLGSSGKGLNSFVGQFKSQQALIDQNNLVNSSFQSAYSTQQVGSNYDEETRIELAMKYKQMSDDLMKMSHELNQTLNQEGNEAVQVTKGERLELMAKAVDYQMKALEYEEKYAELLKGGTALSENDRNEMVNYGRAMGIHEMLMFRQ